MNEQELAERFSNDIDRILQDNKAEITPVGSDWQGYMEAIELARLLAAIDLRGECSITKHLRRRLMDKIGVFEKKQRVGLGSESRELDEDELENVAGGADPHRGHQPED